MVAVAILDFENLKNLTADALWRASVYHRAKLHLNRSSGCGEIVIFRFFNMAAIRHLGFAKRGFGPPTKSIWWSLSVCKVWLKLVQ